jgi:hypothetical protein
MRASKGGTLQGEFVFSIDGVHTQSKVWWEVIGIPAFALVGRSDRFAKVFKLWAKCARPEVLTGPDIY